MAIILLSYTCVDRKNLRIFLVVVAALMTFIIQFMFRKAASFNVGAGLGSNLCLNWDSFVENAFEGESTFRTVSPNAYRVMSRKTWLESSCTSLIFFMP